MFFRKLALRTGLISWLIASFAFSSIPHAHAAPTVLFSSLSNGCVTQYGSTGNINTLKFRATSNITANIVRVAIGTQSQSGFQNSSFYIMNHSAVGGTAGQGSPGSPLAIFTPDTITGSGTTTYATYVGNVSIASGTYFWMSFGNRSSVISYCYGFFASTADLVMNGAVVDTSTSNSNTSWLRAQTSADTSPVNAAWSWRGNQNLAYQFSLEYMPVISPVAVSVALQSGSNATTFRTSTPIIATVDTDSYVTFYSNGKVIPGCIKLLSNNGSAICNWKPSLKGSSSLTATAIPISNSFSVGRSLLKNIGVGARIGRR